MPAERQAQIGHDLSLKLEQGSVADDRWSAVAAQRSIRTEEVANAVVEPFLMPADIES
jgi:hypothetical protein